MSVTRLWPDRVLPGDARDEAAVVSVERRRQCDVGGAVRLTHGVGDQVGAGLVVPAEAADEGFGIRAERLQRRRLGPLQAQQPALASLS